MTPDDDVVKFKLYYPKEEGTSSKLGIAMKYKDVEFFGTFTEGSDAVLDLMKNFPQILRMAHEERKIQEEVRDMSAEIDKLLGDAE